MLTKTLQIELEKFLKVLKGETSPASATKQAFCQARQKFSEQAFIRLDERLVEEFYTENRYKTWKGFRVLGVDGSTVQLPWSDAIFQAFGGVTNQHGVIMNMGRISVLFDVENEISVHAVIDRYTCEERYLALRHLDAVAAFDQRTTGRRGHHGDLLLFDMGYPALYFMAIMLLQGKEFVIRTSDAFLKEVQEAIHSDQEDLIITIPVQTPDRPLPPKLKAHVPEIDPELVLSIRVIQLTLENGVREMLLTTLLDAEKFPYTDFHGLYAKRWGNETHYDVLKNILEIENFTGKSPLSVRQDLYATVLTNNIRGLIHWELQEEVAQENQHSTRTYAYQLNKNLSIGRLKDRIVTLILDQGDLQEFYTNLKREMKRNMIPIRPGRQFPRKRKNRQKYTMTKRRAL